jgi:hypothetical protein
MRKVSYTMGHLDNVCVIAVPPSILSCQTDNLALLGYPPYANTLMIKTHHNRRGQEPFKAIGYCICVDSIRLTLTQKDVSATYILVKTNSSDRIRQINDTPQFVLIISLANNNSVVSFSST